MEEKDRDSLYLYFMVVVIFSALIAAWAIASITFDTQDGGVDEVIEVPEEPAKGAIPIPKKD